MNNGRRWWFVWWIWWLQCMLGGGGLLLSCEIVSWRMGYDLKGFYTVVLGARFWGWRICPMCLVCLSCSWTYTQRRGFNIFNSFVFYIYFLFTLFESSMVFGFILCRASHFGGWWRMNNGSCFLCSLKCLFGREFRAAFERKWKVIDSRVSLKSKVRWWWWVSAGYSCWWDVKGGMFLSVSCRIVKLLLLCDEVVEECEMK